MLRLKNRSRMTAEQRLIKLGCTIDGGTVRDSKGVLLAISETREEAIKKAADYTWINVGWYIEFVSGDERTSTYRLMKNGNPLAEVVHQDSKGEYLMLIELAMKWVENENAGIEPARKEG
jgi:hypothetical protein